MITSSHRKTQADQVGVELSHRRLKLATCMASAIALAASGAYLAISHIQAQARKEKAERIAAEFEKLKGQRKVRVFRDSDVLSLLASDAESIQNLTDLELSMLSIAPADAAAVRSLSNVKRIRAYSCYGIDQLISAISGSPKIEELSFDTTALSDDSIKTLATYPNLRRVYFAFIRYKSQEKLLRESLPSVDIQIDEVGTESHPPSG